MTTVTLISVSAPAVRQTVAYVRDLKARGVEDIDFRIFYFNGERDNFRVDPRSMVESVMESDLCVVDAMATDEALFNYVCEIIDEYKGQRIIVGRPGSMKQKLGRYDEKRFRANPDDVAALNLFLQYYMRCGEGDMESAFNMVLKNYLGHDELPDPVPIGSGGELCIRDPTVGKSYASREEYLADFPRKHSSAVAVFFNALNYPYDCTAVLSDLFTRIREFADVVPIGFNGYDPVDMDRLRELVGDDVTVAMSLAPFRFIAGPMGGSSTEAMELLREMDAPFLRPFFMSRGTLWDWKKSTKGLKVPEFMIFVFTPELDGGICTIPLGTAEEVDMVEDYNLVLSEIRPIPERMDSICAQMKGMIRLRELANSEKRIALIGYNYPPGEGNIFGGSFLDTFGSMENILRFLGDNGYDIGDAPTDDLKREFLDGALLNDGDWITPMDGDSIIYDTDRRHPMTLGEYWGPEPGEILADSKGYRIPGVVHGNIFIGVQPPLSLATGDELAEIYHNPYMPPHHQYLAFYEWVRDEFKADAVVHVGTHGTLEFLPGKEVAMSGGCFPDLVIGNVPHFYMYYVGNPSEAMTAKRRSHATLISYMSPPYVRSDLYGEMSELESLIAEYRESSIVDPGRSDNVLAQIIARAERMRLPTDIDDLEHELDEIRMSLIPRGLHKLGEPFTAEEAEEFAIQSMGFAHDTCGVLENILSERGVEDPSGTADSMFRRFNRGAVPEGYDGDGEVMACLEYERELAGSAAECHELDGLLRALDCRFIEAKLGGDMLRNPEILPTGYNIVQFNPKSVPSESAFERGREAAENTIRMYLDEHGEYPRSVALVMWGLEVSRSQGATVGQILTYLGLRMVEPAGPFEQRFEVIPLEELGRPRIDVTATICGFFRDMFSNLVTGLNKVFAMVNELDEPEDMNFFKAGCRRNYEKLLNDGYTEADAADLSVCRLFGPGEGQYGTNMTSVVEDSTWEDESDLADIFQIGLRYAYSLRYRGVDTRDLMSENHSHVDIVSQIRDNVEYELVDLDHFYEFFGGLSKAVEIARGSKAAMYITDNTAAKLRTTDVTASIEHGIRTRLLNPKWIDGLLETDYHGAQKISDRFTNVLGLAATTGVVDSSVFSDLEACYIADPEMRRRIRENNNWAMLSMIKRLYEANKRGYWSATDEELEQLELAYLESEDMAEEETDRE